MFPSNFSGFPNFRRVAGVCAITFCGAGGGGEGEGEGGGVANLSGVGCLGSGDGDSGIFGNCELGLGSVNPRIVLNRDGIEGVGVTGIPEVQTEGAILCVGGWKNRDSTGFLVSDQYQILFEYDH